MVFLDWLIICVIVGFGVLTLWAFMMVINNYCNWRKSNSIMQDFSTLLQQAEEHIKQDAIRRRCTASGVPVICSLRIMLSTSIWHNVMRCWNDMIKCALNYILHYQLILTIEERNIYGYTI